MREAKCDGLLDDILKETIPMHARMIHGRKKDGLFQESQEYDAHGRVSIIHLLYSQSLTFPSTSKLWTGQASTSVC